MMSTNVVKELHVAEPTRSASTRKDLTSALAQEVSLETLPTDACSNQECVRTELSVIGMHNANMLEEIAIGESIELCFSV